MLFSALYVSGLFILKKEKEKLLGLFVLERIMTLNKVGYSLLKMSPQSFIK